MRREGLAPILAAASLLQAAVAGGAVPPRDPFARPLPSARASAPDVRLAGSVRAGERRLALLVGADGVGLVAEAGTLLPGPGLRVTAVADGAVQVQALGGGEVHVVTAAADAASGEVDR